MRHLGSLYEGMIEYKLFIAEEELLARRDKDGRVKYLSRLQRQSAGRLTRVIKPGKVYFAQSPQERKATGTHYTAEELVERLVRQTVVRLLNERWSAFKPNLDKWLAELDDTPDEAGRVRLQNRIDSELEAFVREQVLSLRICDPAMGSGHFLVHIAYTVTNFILEVLTATSWDNDAVNLDPNHWRRLVVENCLYGVDVNGMAVELAKLSLWLATMQLGQPLSFLDHHLKRGNSLLGARLSEIVEALALSELNKDTRATAVAESKGQFRLRETPKVVQQLETANIALATLASQRVQGVDDIERQEAEYETAQDVLAPYRRIGNLILARKMGVKIADSQMRSIAAAVESGQAGTLTDKKLELLESAAAILAEHEPMHWELEFSTVFTDMTTEARFVGARAFDVIVGNPPFLGGAKISTSLGDPILKAFKRDYPASGQNTDLCAYFFVSCFRLLSVTGLLRPCRHEYDWRG